MMAMMQRRVSVQVAAARVAAREVLDMRSQYGKWSGVCVLDCLLFENVVAWAYADQRGHDRIG
jgi:hypothetical protein